MQYKTIEELRRVADILPERPRARPLSKRERLERWAVALEREGDRRLNTLRDIEYVPPQERAGLRADDSPLTVAFNDPRLRAAGLAGDRVGDAVAFFGISAMELHDILCFCHHGSKMSAAAAAARVRAAVAHRRMCTQAMVVGAVVPASILVGALLI
jgi:hypothetical protein